MTYDQLTLDERYTMSRLRMAGYGAAEIARVLKRLSIKLTARHVELLSELLSGRKDWVRKGDGDFHDVHIDTP